LGGLLCLVSSFGVGRIRPGLLALAVSDYTIGYGLEIAGTDLSAKMFAAKIEYFGATTISPLWLVFCYSYFTQRKQLPLRIIAALGIVPLITVFLAFTTELHGLIWTSYVIERIGNFSHLDVTHGVWFWIFWVYSYILLIIAAYFIIRLIRHKYGFDRGQIMALIAAAVAPWVANLLYISHLVTFDVTPFGFTVAVVVTAWGIFRFRLINLVPLARDTVVEAMEIGMIVIDSQGRVADINRAAINLIGLPAKQIIHKPVVEALSRWSHLTKKYQNVLEALDEISIDEGEHQRWFELGLSPLRNDDQTVIGRLVTLRDITIRRQIGERVRQLSRAVDASPASIVITDVDGRIQYVNPKFTAVTGYTLPEVFGKNSRILKTDQTPPEVHQQLWNTIASGREWHGEFCNRKKNGELYWETASISPIFDANGRITNYVAVKEDITEQRRMQEQLQVLYDSAMREVVERKRTEVLLQESEARYRQIVENAYEIIYRTDTEGCVTYANSSVLRLFGMDKVSDILGRNHSEFIVPDWRAKVRRFYVYQFLSGESNTYFEFPILGSDGHELWLGQNVQIVREAGQIIGFQAVARDITAIKRAQEALSLAKDQAQQASHFKSDLLARVSHELRTPLAGILGYAELLRDQALGSLSKDQTRAVETIAQSSEYLSTMISDLMDQAQIEAKKLVLNFSECSPAGLLRNLDEMMGVLARKKGLILRTILEPDVPALVYSDEQRLRQILINLVANAIKFTNRGRLSDVSSRPTHWASRYLTPVLEYRKKHK
jgi:PAS domain S-box-containing protein